ncbi:hypothetical protein HMPREF0298_2261 [Corynebacterium lipophiloflavum DSM 44291]|uniref:Uncharacterized protein n=2 Tax=Corynebacteriaceae TaxID=1653 RepID=C0XUZ1_CORLD|nr:hypothetical protein HMPREF0298_2261 [Corynebacterium lipophiloflavum DSM 44291]
MLVANFGPEGTWWSVEQSNKAMRTFVVDASEVAALTSSLRTAAAQITDIPPAAVPGFGPAADFHAALASAIGRVNDRCSQLRAEALRLADVMDLTVDATTSVDGSLARDLKAVL